MRRFLTHLIAIVIITCNYSELNGQNLEKEFDKILQGQFSTNTPGSAVLVVKDDKVIYRKSIGLANLDTQMAIEPNQVFRIASITKQFTAMAILKLAYEDKLSLQDSVQKFIPDFAKNNRPINISQLLNHTSGLLNQYDIEHWEEATTNKTITPTKLIELFKDKQPAFEPGSQYQYSNLGYMVLTHIIEVTSKQSYAEYLNANFFKPLGMTDTQYGDTQSSDKVVGYSKNNEDFKQAQFIDMNIAQGAGGLSATVDDLYKWNKAVFTPEVLGKYLGASHQPGKLTNGQSFGYGYGWQIGEVQGRKAIKHDGIINGFISYQIYLPQEKAYAVILTNCDCTEDIAQLAAKIMAIAINDPYVFKGVDLEEENLTRYQGIYTSALGEEKIVNLHDGTLYVFSKGGTKLPLLPIAEHTFYVENDLNKLRFNLNDNAKATGYKLSGLDLPTVWKKTDNLTAINTLPTSSDILNQYYGKYKFKNAFTLEITGDGNQIFGLVGNDKKQLYRYDEHSFYSKTNDIKLQFIFDENEKIKGVKLIQVHDMIADKIE